MTRQSRRDFLGLLGAAATIPTVSELDEGEQNLPDLNRGDPNWVLIYSASASEEGGEERWLPVDLFATRGDEDELWRQVRAAGRGEYDQEQLAARAAEALNRHR